MPAGNDFVVIATGVLHSLAIQQVVPEPASIALLVVGLPLLIWRPSRRSDVAAHVAHVPMLVSVVSNWRRNTNPR